MKLYWTERHEISDNTEKDNGWWFCTRSERALNELKAEFEKEAKWILDNGNSILYVMDNDIKKIVRLWFKEVPEPLPGYGLIL